MDINEVHIVIQMGTFTLRLRLLEKSLSFFFQGKVEDRAFIYSKVD